MFGKIKIEIHSIIFQPCVEVGIISWILLFDFLYGRYHATSFTTSNTLPRIYSRFSNQNTYLVSINIILSHGFCCFIYNLGLCFIALIIFFIRCLEFQFDSVPIDRPAILKRLYHLFNCLMDRQVLTWQVWASVTEYHSVP